MKSDVCRLCGAEARRVFHERVLEQYEVGYFECGACGSLQTERPHWLDEAYAIPGVHIDVGQAARVIATWLRLCRLLERLGFDRTVPCVDYGGSTGLLARLMRDSGYDFAPYDRYAGCTFANYFRVADFASVSPGLITAFEVLEHFPEPAASLREIFAKDSELVVFSTQFYEGQGRDWDYLVPFCGQHVFFYTQRGLARFASEAGYGLLRAGDFWALHKADGAFSAGQIAAACAEPPDDAFVAGLVGALGYGTRDTQRDFAYAKERFVCELKADAGGDAGVAEPPRTRLGRWLRGVAPRRG